MKILRRFADLISPLALLCAACGSALAESTPPPDADPAFHQLDFWVGYWRVVNAQTGQPEGSNRIEKILKGCALIEHWTEADGSSEGKSLFYYNPANQTWKQVWVTDTGSTKEKQMITAALPAGALRFQGEIPLRGGKSVLDRTTLAPLPDGRVRQTIEISRDHGASWQISFDAFYLRTITK
jgi:hypothetical protein